MKRLRLITRGRLFRRMSSAARSLRSRYVEISLVAAILIVLYQEAQTGWIRSGVRAKTSWDWLDLLFVPAMLAILVWRFNHSENRTDRSIARDKRESEVLQTYLDKMSELILKEKLGEQGTTARVIARARTLTALRQLTDSGRKADVLRFLYEADLISRDSAIVDLNGADLRGANLRNAVLIRAALGGANLEGATLVNATLRHSDLSWATLSGADMRLAELEHVTLEHAIAENVNLSRARLTAADLSSAVLTAADLERALLGTAKLNWTDLSATDLSFVDTSEADLTKAWIDNDTTLVGKPSGRGRRQISEWPAP